ncbi:MAG: DUF2285 domain-containing protein [Pseudomonadota bacterium]
MARTYFETNGPSNSVAHSDVLHTPLAGWAWAFLRRNADYRRDYLQWLSGDKKPKNIAERWGLLAFADPELDAIASNVFWSPHLLLGALRVSFEPLKPPRFSKADTGSRIVLSRLNCHMRTLETENGSHHIRLGGDTFWIQLYCPSPPAQVDQAQLVVSLADFTNGHRVLDTAAHLFALHRARGRSLPVQSRAKQALRLSRMLRVHYICSAGGTYRDAAVALYGAEKVVAEWGASGRCSRDQIRRLFRRSAYYIGGGYRDLLQKKSV